MGGSLQFTAGVALVLAAWTIPRRVARARPSWGPALLLDAAPIFLGASLLLWASGRPLFTGLVAVACGAGFALADSTMREVLREPVVFSATVEVPQVFTHPHLYLPFAGPGLVIGGAATMTAAALALLFVEPPIFAPQLLPAAATLGAVVSGVWLLGREPLLRGAAAIARGLRPTGEPFADTAALGPFGMLLAHCTIARAERTARQMALRAPALLRSDDRLATPVILVQCESFFDARRLSPLVPRAILAGFDECCRSAAMYGRLVVPGWGANTMRTEFAVLSGVAEDALGYDRFNPYYALARVPLGSQVWRMRAAGYRTICLHPFDRRFFRRDLALPALGFEKFLGRETLGGSRSPPYYPDPDLARQALRVLDAEGPQIFMFIITMGNHGPWLPTGAAADPDVGESLDLVRMPQGHELRRYLDGLQRSDEMLGILMDGLRQRGRGLLGFYGDHLPSLPRAFRHFDFDEPHSDYVIWPATGGTPQRLDLPAHRLGCAIADMVLGRPEQRVDAPAVPFGVA